MDSDSRLSIILAIISAIIPAIATIFAVFLSNKKTLQFQKDKDISDNYIFPIVNIKKLTYLEILNEHFKFSNGRHLIFTANNGNDIELKNIGTESDIKKIYFHLKNPSSTKRMNNVKIISTMIIKDLQKDTTEEKKSEIYFNLLRPNDNLYLKLLEDSKLLNLIDESKKYEITIKNQVYYSTLEKEHYFYEYDQQINTVNNKIKEIIKDNLEKTTKYEMKNNSKYMDFIEFLIDNGIDILTVYWMKQGNAQNSLTLNELKKGVPILQNMENKNNK